LPALLALMLAGGVSPAWAADAQAEADIRRVLRVIATLNLTDPTTKRRIETVLADEALDRWRQGKFVRLLGEPDLIHVLDGGLAVARYREQRQILYDVYVYLQQDPVWRVVAVRAMDQTGMLIRQKQQLEAIWFRSATENARLENLRLALATDRELGQWFARHRREMDALAQAYRRAAPGAPSLTTAPDLASDPIPATPSPLTPEQAAATSDVAARCAALHLTGVGHLSEEEAPGKDEQTPVLVTIGGALNNQVGFVHAPAGGPLITTNRFIWVESLGDGWYLIRTI
jgi:hypothetical protein